MPIITTLGSDVLRRIAATAVGDIERRVRDPGYRGSTF